MLNDAGESVLYFDSVHLQEVRDEHLQKAVGKTKALEPYDILWPIPILLYQTGIDWVMAVNDLNPQETCTMGRW